MKFLDLNDSWRRTSSIPLPFFSRFTKHWKRPLNSIDGYFLHLGINKTLHRISSHPLKKSVVMYINLKFHQQYKFYKCKEKNNLSSRSQERTMGVSSNDYENTTNLITYYIQVHKLYIIQQIKHPFNM